MNTKAKVGDIIKSLDFSHDDTTYFIGRVTKVDCEMIYADTIIQVIENEVKEGSKTFRTVQQGSMMLDNAKSSLVRITIL